MLHAIKFFFEIALPLLAAGGLLTSFAEFKKNYNLIDLIKDKIDSLRGKAVLDAQYVIKVARWDVAHIETAIRGLPQFLVTRITKTIRKKV